MRKDPDTDQSDKLNKHLILIIHYDWRGGHFDAVNIQVTWIKCVILAVFNDTVPTVLQWHPREG